jgi:small subunit ribosomal protein S16
MALKIRLARGGAKKRPFYRIVVAEASSPRDGRFVERIGSYNPMLPSGHDDRLVLDGERAKYWMSKGAKPTLRVHKMMAGIGLLDSPEIREQPKKSAPGQKRLDREEAAAEAAAAAAEAAAEAEAAPAEAPAEEAPAEAAPVEDAVAEDAVAEEAPAEDAVAEEAPAEEAPAEAEEKA